MPWQLRRTKDAGGCPSPELPTMSRSPARSRLPGCGRPQPDARRRRAAACRLPTCVGFGLTGSLDSRRRRPVLCRTGPSRPILLRTRATPAQERDRVRRKVVAELAVLRSRGNTSTRLGEIDARCRRAVEGDARSSSSDRPRRRRRSPPSGAAWLDRDRRTDRRRLTGSSRAARADPSALRPP